MPIQVPINESISRGRDIHVLTKAVKEGLLIRDYLNAEISLGELAELLGLEYIQAREWLHSQGIATSRKLPADLTVEVKIYESELAHEMGIESHFYSSVGCRSVSA